MSKIYPGGGEIPLPKFCIGDHVRKISGSRWQGIIVGTYSTALTPEGYAVESDTETGSVQIYPARALEPVYAGQRGSLGEVKAGDAYFELLYAVVRKFPNETRHETALRYIREAEQQEVAPAKEVS